MTQNDDDSTILPADTDLFAAAQGGKPQPEPPTTSDPYPPRSASSQPEPPARSRGGVPAWSRGGVPAWIWWLVGAVVVIGGTIGALAAAGVFQAEPEVLPTPTITAEPPTPTESPITPAEDATALEQALPASSLQYVLSAISPSETWVDLEPLEEFEATYSDAQAGNFEVTVAQWADEDNAHAAWVEITDEFAGEVVSSGEVQIGADAVGNYTVFDNAVVWRNGTVVLAATGPQQDLVNFYTAFGL